MSSEIATKLSEQTRNLVARFEGRMSLFRGRGDLLELTRSLDRESADDFAREYFGEGDHLAIGIDGSRAYDERLQMMLFYANAAGYTCPFRVDDTISFDLGRAARGASLSASAAIPLWAEDFSDVLPETPEIDIELEYSMQRIPNAFMTLAELYLATKAMGASRIVFLDRPLSGTFSTLSRDGRLLMKRGSTNLGRLPGVESHNTLMDLSLALNLGSPETALPERRRFNAHRILRELMAADGGLADGEIAARLRLDQRSVSSALRTLRRYDANLDGSLLEEGGGVIRLGDGVSGYWPRAVRVARSYAERVFEKNEPPLSVGDDQWLTILDVNMVSLVLLEWLCELARTKKVLLIGMAKDTTATDIHRAVLPFSIQKETVRPRSSPPALKNDRAFLSVLSAMNHELGIPWRTRGYDAAFSTMLATSDGEFVPARKVVSREQRFVRGYFQSRSLGTSGRIRSQVFLFDRIFEPGFDSGGVDAVKVKEQSGRTEVRPYYEGGLSDPVSNLILRILALTDNPEVYEAFGHNQLLYLADKAVKSEIRLMHSSLRGVADLRLGSMAKREQVYGITTPYREQRAGVEASRREGARVD